jgi:hypothetical protein
MPIFSPVAFPIFPIVEGKCGCGNEKCSRIGKHPAVAWGDVSFGDRVSRPAEGAGYGLKTGAAPKGSDVFVVDLDGPDAIEAWQDLCDEGDATETYTVETPRGVHLYFAHPGFHVGNSAGMLAKGVDIRGDGGFVVGPDSPHRSGGRYTLAIDVPPAPAPEWLLEWLRARPAPAEIQTYDGDCVDPVERTHRRSLFAKACATMPPSIEGEGGDLAVWRLVQYGAGDLALPVEDVIEDGLNVFNPRCVPPWNEDELRSKIVHKANDAKMKSTRPLVEPAPADVAHIFTLEVPPKPVLPPPARAKTDIFWDAWDEPVPPIPWLVEPLIPKATVGGFVAHGSSLKTWTMLSLGGAIAQGVPWLGKFTTQKGRVLVLDYESGLYELRRRVQLLEGGRVPGLGAWSYPPHIDDLEFWKRLAAIEDVALLCVDSLAAGTSPGVDENDKSAAYPLELAGRYAEGTGASVCFIHHSKKDDGGDARKAVRGSTAIFAAMDWCYGFEPIEETTAFTRMRMACIKPCMGAKPMPFGIELTNAGLHVFDGGAARVSQTAEEIRESIREKLRALSLSGASTTIADKLLSWAGVDIKKGRIELKEMLNKKEIVSIDGVGYMLDTLEARRDRILNSVRANPLFKTEGAIAEHAYVTTREVDALIQSRSIFRSGDGQWFVQE